MTSSEARDLIAAACHHLAARGLSPGGSGNVSVRTGSRLLCTPTGSSLSRVRPDQLIEVPVDGDATPPAGPRPTKELPVHRAVYAARPDAGAVVHLHSHYAVAASCLEPTGPGPGTGPLAPWTPYQILRLGHVPVAPYAPPGSAELGRGVAALAGTHAVILLAHHGSVAAAGDLGSAVDLAEELEAAARLHLELSRTTAHPLAAEQVAGLRL
jgi:ribulose-5-phosphate 4-epimerase/fuculose-1-phosphate aldolase